MNFNFPPKEGTGIDRLIPNAPAECVDIIKKLLAYNPDDRFINIYIFLFIHSQNCHFYIYYYLNKYYR